MAEENLVTNIVAKSDFSDLVSDLNKVSGRLVELQQQLNNTNKVLANQAKGMQTSFANTLRSTGQFSTHFVSLSSDVEKFGKSLDSGKMKLGQYYQAWQQHARTSGGLVRDLAKQQVQMQNAVLQPLGKNAQGLMQFNVHVPRGLDVIKNKTAIAATEMKILNKVIQDGANQVINWGKNTQWAGRQLSVGLTLPIVAFGKAASDAFNQADQALVRLTKVYGGVAATSASDLKRIRNEVAATAKELSSQYGASFTETIGLAADIAATGKTGNDLLKSTVETTRLAVLGEVDRQEAMKATLAIQNAFKQNTEELSQSINFLNAVENQTSTSLQDLIEAIPKAGPVVQSLGGSIEDLALYLTAMREGGVNASEGANALKSALASLINPTKVAKEMFMGMGIDLGGIVNQNAGNLTGTIMALQGALDNLDPLQKSQAIEQLFGKFQFARMNALFANLGKQGSQTLQVLDLMKASSEDLANIAGRELSQITESASGKYKRAIESLRADLAATGEQFLGIATSIINVVDGLIKFVDKLPDPVKKALGFLGGLTALTGPLIMLTGLLANFFGYVAKGLFHLKALFKGGEGFKLLTPEILAAQKAGSAMEQTFYSDAKAASILKQAIASLTSEISILEAKAKSAAVSVNPTISTVAGQVLVQGSGRVVDKNSPYLGPAYSREMSHTNALAGMSEQQRINQTIFGVVPGTGPVNKKVGTNPQSYMSGDLPKFEGVSSSRGVSTGIVAEEAAKWHSMTAALAMQSDQELKLLKAEVAKTGNITSSLSGSYQALLPEMTQITSMAAEETRLIVSQLQAGKLTVDSAKAKIIQLNQVVEQMMIETAQAIALTQGRVANLTAVPLTNQPVVNPQTGQTNMREMFKGNNNLIDKIARNLGVKTSGGSFSIETTKPRKFAMGGSVVPGSGNSDTVPAMLTPGEFVVNAKATRANLPLLKAINGKGSSGPMYNMGSSGAVEEGWDVRTSGLSGEDVSKVIPGFAGQSNRVYSLKGTAGLYIGDVTDKAIVNEFGTSEQKKAGKITRASINNRMKSSSVPGRLLAAAMQSSGSANRGSTEQFLNSLAANGIITQEEATSTSNAIYKKYLSVLEKPAANMVNGNNINDANNHYWKVANSGVNQLLGSNPEVKNLWGQFSQGIGAHTGDTTSKAGKSGASTSSLMQTLTTTNGEKIKVGSLRGKGGSLFAHAAHPEPFLARLGKAGLGFFKIGKGMPRGKYVPRAGFNSGGLVGYQDGGQVKPSLSSGYMANLGYSAASLKSGAGSLSMPRMSGPAQMGIGMGGMMAGQMVGGSTGMAIMMASNILPMLSGLKMVGGFLPTIKALAGVLGRLTIPGAIVGTLFGVGMALNRIRENATAAGEVNRAMFGGTQSALSEVGLKYKSIADRVKDINQQLELTRAKAKSAFESRTSAGGGGLSLTIAQLKEGIKSARTNQKETVGLFDKADSSQVLELASSLKAQYVALGMSAQDATNAIYTVISASTKSKQALSAITSRSFIEIRDTATAATYQVEKLGRIASDQKLFNAEEFAVGIEAAVASLDKYKTDLTVVADKNGNVKTQTEAISATLEKIRTIRGATAPIEGKNLEQLKAQNTELAMILGKSESIYSIFAKQQLALAGLSNIMDIGSLSSSQAVSVLQGYEAISSAAKDIVSSTTVGGKTISSLAEAADKAAKNSANAAKNASKMTSASYDSAIKNNQKLIDKLEEERKKRLEILDIQEQSQNFETSLKQAQIRYQEALAAGDMAQAAQEQLNVQKLTADKERELARKAINDRFDADRKKLEEANKRLQEKSSAVGSGVSGAQAKAASAAEGAASINRLVSDISSALAMNTQNASKGSQALGLIIEEAIKAGGGAGKIAEQLKSQSKPLYTGGTPTSTDPYLSMYYKMDKSTDLKAASSEFKIGVKDFNKAVENFTGKKTATNNKPLYSRYLPGLRQASGGYISGPGTSTSDSIPAMLSNGEYVINAKSVQAAGVPMLDKINKMAKGGLATKFDVPTSSMGRARYANGGMASSSNSLYNINVNVAGTNANPNDIARAISQEMRLREAMNGVGRRI